MRLLRVFLRSCQGGSVELHLLVLRQGQELHGCANGTAMHVFSSAPAMKVCPSFTYK